jgi:hypothetical protein
MLDELSGAVIFLPKLICLASTTRLAAHPLGLV